MQKPTKPENKAPRANTFWQKYLPRGSWSYYGSVFFAAMFFALAVFPPYNPIQLTLANVYISLLCATLARYRYQEWKPEKSQNFAIGAASVIRLVHEEGVLYYDRDGDHYALYSNKATPPTERIVKHAAR